jgi:hypothetical protein
MKMSKLENGNNWNKRQGQHINYGGSSFVFERIIKSRGWEGVEAIVSRIFFKSNQRCGKKVFVSRKFCNKSCLGRREVYALKRFL